MRSTRGVFPVLTRRNALTPSLRATPLPRGFMGGQSMRSTCGVFPVLTRRNALTPSLRATPLPHAGEGPGVRVMLPVATRRIATRYKRSVPLSRTRERGIGGEGVWPIATQKTRNAQTFCPPLNP
jgi:hypothetical protein